MTGPSSPEGPTVLQPMMIFVSIGHNAEIDIAVAAQLSEVEVDLDDLPLGSDAVAEAQPEVERRPDHDDDVGLS